MEIKNLINNYLIQPFSSHPKLAKAVLGISAITVLAILILRGLYQGITTSRSLKGTAVKRRLMTRKDLRKEEETENLEVTKKLMSESIPKQEKESQLKEVKNGCFTPISEEGYYLLGNLYSQNLNLCDEELVEALLENCKVGEAGPISKGDDFNNTPLISAIANAEYSNALFLVRYCKEKEIDMNLSHRSNVSWNTALLLALKKEDSHSPQDRSNPSNRIRMVKNWEKYQDWKQLVLLLIEMSDKATLDTPDQKGNTPLHVACYRRDKEITEALIKKGADIAQGNSEGKTASQLWDLYLSTSLPNYEKYIRRQNLAVGLPTNDILDYSRGTVTFDLAERANIGSYAEVIGDL